MPNPKEATIADRLKALRISREMTVSDVSRRSGVNKTTLGLIERCAQRDVGLDVLERLARAFNVRPSYLLFGDEGGGTPSNLEKCMAFYDDNNWRPETIAAAKYVEISDELKLSPSEWAEKLNEIESRLNDALGTHELHSRVYTRSHKT